MYRILDVEAAFAYLPPASRPFTLKVVADDPFLPAIGGTWTYGFGPAGAPRSVASVVRLGLANLEPREQLGLVDGAFRAPRPPQCATRF